MWGIKLEDGRVQMFKVKQQSLKPHFKTPNFGQDFSAALDKAAENGISHRVILMSVYNHNMRYNRLQ